MPRQTDLIAQARARGITADQLPDDAKIADIDKALAALGPTPEEAAQAAAAAVDAEGNERFGVERLIAEADGFFGHPGYVAAGAFSGLDRKTLSVAEGREAIEAWLASAVQQVDIEQPAPEEAQI